MGKINFEIFNFLDESEDSKHFIKEICTLSKIFYSLNYDINYYEKTKRYNEQKTNSNLEITGKI